jgi:Fe-S-cluster containining protein
MDCRKGCGVCCIAISISSSIPGMPKGKKAGVRCIHLRENNVCAIHDAKNYPVVCANLKPSLEMCGESEAEAMAYLTKLEDLTRPV